MGIGGINAGNEAEVLAAGSERIALISGILSQPDIKEAARNLWRILDASVGRV